MQDTTTPQAQPETHRSRSVTRIQTTPPGERKVSEIRIEKTETNGEKQITLTINGKTYHPANEE